MFKLEYVDGNARYGVINAHGISVETPVFVPVATKGVVRTLLPEEAWDAGSRIVIANALHLYMRAFPMVIKHGIHDFMKWKGIILTDSGGFQSIKNFPAKVTDEGVVFTMPDGSREIFTPERSIEIQKSMGSDFAYMLDDCPKYPYGRKRVIKSVKRTIEWARRSQGEGVFAIAQGGVDEELRKKCALEMAEMNFSGYAVGGLSIGEPKEMMHRMVEVSTSLLPEDKPRHLMGVGSPQDIINAVKNGIDIFDSAFPTRNARHGTIYTSKGKINLKRHGIKGDVIDKACDCYTCRNYSLEHLSYLFREKEQLALRLATIHNLRYMNRLMERIREEIRNGGDTDKLKEEFGINKRVK
ncbi:MAG: tRNA guanosine(34) transglycosylase Tgt [Thermoplasmata archaeon]|nr:tRNA guanosine(34) transglycosylase Tgt [Thermoplasmata archaeon]